MEELFMDPNWILAIILWGVIIGTIVVCLVAECKKTPEQRAVEAKRIQDTIKRKFRVQRISV